MRNKKLVPFIISCLFILSAFLLSCTHDNDNDYDQHHTYGGSGYLKIRNNTNAPINITWTADHSHSTVNQNSSQVFTFDMDNHVTNPTPISTTYICEGLYLHSATFTDDIYEGQTTIRNIDPDRGCLSFNNNTEGPVDVSIPGLNDPITVMAHQQYIQAWVMEDMTGNVSFSLSGDFVFTSSGDAVLHLNETRSYGIEATGAAIKVRNYSSSSITKVFISPHGDSSWGDNDLYGTIDPGHYVVWTVSPNQWDVKVVSQDGNYSAWVDNGYTEINHYLVLDYDLSKASNANGFKPEGQGSTHEGNNRIQQKIPHQSSSPLMSELHLN
ncbi:MAG TPA: hypothetical protein PLE74_08640 [Candidatus Cloacimonadota bacterium]|nr:hypothetical protein [Candidatus Cloacimonadota bacterium]HPT72334.1 hypothetical protein [Candidatus Cloacimonadota bacterium]